MPFVRPTALGACSGNSMSKVTSAGPLASMFASVSPFSLFNGLCCSRVEQLRRIARRPAPAQYNSALLKSGMPARICEIPTPASAPLPSTENPLPTKLMGPDRRSVAGQSGGTSRCASSSSASARNRPFWCRKGQSSRSPDTIARPFSQRAADERGVEPTFRRIGHQVTDAGSPCPSEAASDRCRRRSRSTAACRRPGTTCRRARARRSRGRARGRHRCPRASLRLRATTRCDRRASPDARRRSRPANRNRRCASDRP